MKKYYVCIREVHIAHYEVEASNKADAIKEAKNISGDDIYLEYSHTMGDDHITVEAIK